MGTRRAWTGTSVALAAGLSACSAGGGGGEDAGASFETGSGVLVYQFGSFNAALVATGAESFSMRFLYDGALDLDAQVYSITTQLPYTIDDGGAFGPVDVDVTEMLVVPVGGRPRSGVLEAVRASNGDRVVIEAREATGDLLLTTDALGDGAGVTGPLVYDWDALEALFDDPGADELERLASLVFRATTLSWNHFMLTVEAFERSFERAEALEAAGPGAVVGVPGACESLPGAGAGGGLDILWQDLDLDAAISDGDELALQHSDCGTDRAAGIDSVYDGLLRLSGIFVNDEPFSTAALVLVGGLDETRVDAGAVLPGTVTTSAEFSASFYDLDG